MVSDDVTPPPDADDTTWTPTRRHPGPWTFDFELDVDGGTTILPEAVAEVDGVMIRVTRVIAASDIVRVEARVEGAPADGGWAPVGTISHGGRSAKFVMSSLEDDGSVAMVTDGGLGDAPGAWTITFDDLVGGAENLPGPWVLTFDSP